MADAEELADGIVEVDDVVLRVAELFLEGCDLLDDGVVTKPLQDHESVDGLLDEFPSILGSSGGDPTLHPEVEVDAGFVSLEVVVHGLTLSFRGELFTDEEDFFPKGATSYKLSGPLI